MKIFNTYTRKTEDFVPLTPGEAKVYCCGPTVYNYQHIGNFKTFIVENLLVRTLKASGLKTNFVMNITDVGHLVSDADDGEDKMLLAAKREKKKSHEIADYYTEHFFKDWDRLKLLRPNITCKATEHIQEMIDLIKTLEEKDVAYFSNGNVYFDVSKFKDYGKLANLNLEQQRAGARIEVDPHKRNSLDFVLWFTRSKFENHELLWDSPWGKGYPGWHIECSAMSIKYLGEQFDIHCGGIDHIPVHHTNEIAQTEAATGKKWVNVWVHSEFILINSERMAKSKGNFLVLDDLMKQGYSPLAYKMLCLSTHYRKQLNFSKESMDNAAANLKKLESVTLKLKTHPTADSLSSKGKEHQEKFLAALNNDLNSPQAIAELWQMLEDESLSEAEKLALLYNFDEVLGFDLKNLEQQKIEISAEVQKLLDQRQAARKSKDWAESDRLRDEIKDLGYNVIDAAGKQEITLINPAQFNFVKN